MIAETCKQPEHKDEYLFTQQRIFIQINQTKLWDFEDSINISNIFCFVYLLDRERKLLQLFSSQLNKFLSPQSFST